MILTGPQIHKEVQEGRIRIEPFFKKNLNPNSYNYHLGDTVKVASPGIIDPCEQKNWQEFKIPNEGFLLKPTTLYLANTFEYIGSYHYVTSLIGRSSMGRIGLYLQISADLAQLGAIHRWTLELHVVQPLRVYSGMEIGQVSFWFPEGKKFYYDGVYGKYSAPLEFQPIMGSSQP